MTVGWDIGGVNTKAARVAGGRVLAVGSRAFELQHDPGSLVQVLRSLAAEVGCSAGDVHAVTMTAELSQMFRTKRDGVRFVIEAVEAAFPGAPVQVYSVGGRFLSAAEASMQPLIVAAANWTATARLVAQYVTDALLVDIGTTSTDVIPIVGGEVVARGWTDPDRLASGELVYTGAVRTPVEALASVVPFGDGQAGVSAEGFALAGDVHVWRGDLRAADYTAPTPDRRPATREFAGERLARAICADREMVDESGVSAIADAFAAAQVERVAAAIARVRGRHALGTAVVTGLGAFIAERAARQTGMTVVPLASALGEAAARCAPAASVALLLERAADHPAVDRQVEPAAVVDTVVKIGGGLLAHDGQLENVLAAISDLARERRLLIVPGGGPFADAVREQDERLGLSDDAAHWMAVLAMDQYAYLLASKLPGSAIVSDVAAIGDALGAGSVPVLAPSAWLRRADPLPHSWQVTSDSIAAWVGVALGAGALLLVKPPGASGPGIVDPYFERVRGGLSVSILSADLVGSLRSMPR